MSSFIRQSNFCFKSIRKHILAMLSVISESERCCGRPLLVLIIKKSHGYLKQCKIQFFVLLLMS